MTDTVETQMTIEDAGALVIGDLEFHPLANLFPLMEGEAFQTLCQDIKGRGMEDPIWLYDGQILDGRNRYRAHQEMGLEVDAEQFRVYAGDDPLGFVVSKNLHRRHLDESQRALVAARIANMRQGERTDLSAIAGKSISQEGAASLLNVSADSVGRAAKVLKKAAPALVTAVEKGQVSVTAAATAVDAMEQYPFMNSPHWSPSAIGQAKKALEKLGADERPVVAELVERAKDDSSLGVAIAEKVANASTSEKREFFQSLQSDDEREQSKARTWAASREPMPDPRLSICRDLILRYENMMKRFPDEPEEVFFQRAIAATEQAIESIKCRSKEGTLAAA